jgi:glutamate N-acetyltransferase / amino-acid N-acetyltransferase
MSFLALMKKPALYKKGDKMKKPKGFKAAGISCGIKKGRQRDLALIVSETPCAAAGYFTKNKFAAAPVELCRKHLEMGSARALIINSGCANACTGEKGLDDAVKMAKFAAEATGCAENDILVSSTGVIGAYLPMKKIEKGVSRAARNLNISGWENAARAIMTTDTVPKITSIDFEICGSTVTFLGFAKGSGMIHPDMATMLAYVVTDADISVSSLKKASSRAVNRSFNCLTVDGDTSTNDSVMFLANGMAGNKKITSGKDYKLFEEVLTEVCQVLARKIAGDGEGATRLIEVKVNGARSEKDAKKVAFAVAESSLVKTAIFGRDANWGRIVCAIGYSGATFNPDKISVYIGPELIFSEGAPQLKSEKGVNRVLAEKEIPITIDLNNGDKSVTVWSCDLTYDYVKINADYRS